VTIQQLCLEYRCDEAQAYGAEGGRCDCPCHDMTEVEVTAFVKALRVPIPTPEVAW
jgi:hypothetical protein